MFYCYFCSSLKGKGQRRDATPSDKRPTTPMVSPSFKRGGFFKKNGLYNMNIRGWLEVIERVYVIKIIGKKIDTYW